MENKPTQKILVVNSHAGFLIPNEIDPQWLCDDFTELVRLSNDLYTDILYNFTGLLGNQQIVFPFTPVLINANKHPDHPDQSVPLENHGHIIYKAGCEPDQALRQLLIQKYHLPFHQSISSAKKDLILDAHSTMDGDIDQDGSLIKQDIILDDFQQTEFDPAGGLHTAPPGYVDTYANELTKLLPGNISVTVNSQYTHVYGHIMAVHSWNGSGPRENRAPLILQETNERLYVENGMPAPRKIAELQRIFSRALANTLEKIIHSPTR